MRKRFEALWAIRPEAVPTVVRLLALDTGKIVAGPEAAAWMAAQPSMKGRGPNKVAVIPVQGVLTNDGPAYYGSNYQTIANAAEKAAADPDVQRIILSVDSPGGEVTGLPETASLLASIAKQKPISAIVEGTAASAAYWLASQASDITLTPSGEVGSVGVRMMHVDMSKMLENDGIKVTELYSGEHKTEWSPYKPLSNGAQADMQGRLDASHQEFLGAVKSGRGGRASASIAKARFGEGRIFSASDALAHGLVDRVRSSRDAYRAIALAAPVDGSGQNNGLRRARLDLKRLKV